MIAQYTSEGLPFGDATLALGARTVHRFGLEDPEAPSLLCHMKMALSLVYRGRRGERL